VHEAQDYASIINRGYIGYNPIRYCLITNGMKTKLVLVDQDKPILELNFEDFTEDSEKYWNSPALRNTRLDLLF